MTYPIYEITDYASIEQLGSKQKFWYYDPESQKPKLFKIGREGTGENWAEKVTCELLNMLGIPCAQYDFARWNNNEGITSTNFVPKNCALIHGNELISMFVDDTYPSLTKKLKIPEYKISNVFKLFEHHKGIVNLPYSFSPSSDIQSVGDLFTAYLMFDCWIGNTDRHHQNWGYIYNNQNSITQLAPTFDHASSLGCRVSQQEITDRLTTTNYRYKVSHYVMKAKTPFFDDDEKPMKTLDAFIYFYSKYPTAGEYWINKLSQLNETDIQNVFNKIPTNLISDKSIEFSIEVLNENKNRLLDIRGI